MIKNAKWISGGESADGSIYIRKVFETEKDIKKATLYICALGYGVTEINGENVTDEVLSTPFTAFDKRVLYNEYDVTPLLKTGKNVILTEIGNGWYNCLGKTWDYEKASWKDRKKLAFILEIEFKDGEKAVIESDKTCKGADSPTVYNHTREGEIYDARLEYEGVSTADFDDSNWENAYLVNPPGGIIEKAELPPIREIRTLKGKYLGNGIYDFGENISGYGRVRVNALNERGREISLIYSERYEHGDIDTKKINWFQEAMGHIDKYICKGAETEVWSPKFLYHGFRYIKVENAPKNFEIEAVVVHTDLKTVGKFECSDEMLNKIHEASIRSTLTNYHSVPTDCPHREQNGWTGDAAISGEQALMNFDMTDAYLKWMKDFKDVQRPNGQLPGIVPTSGWGFNWGSGPAWDCAMFIIPKNVYNITGNTELIKQMYPNMKLYMDYIKGRSENGIAAFGLGDWCPPFEDRICPNYVTDTAYYYVFAKLMAEFAEIMGEDKSEYEETAKFVKNAWRKAFMSDKSLEIYQTYYACGIYQGLFNEDEIPQMAEKLADLVIKNDYHIDCGILGTKYIFTALCENGYGDVLYKMVTNPTFPSYAYWINQGMTTLCENWNMDNSRNHHMFSEVDNWFYKYLGGVRMDKGEVTVKPEFIDGIKWVKAEHKGIKVYYDEKEVRITLPKTGKIILGGKTEEKEAGEYIYKR